MVPSIDTILVSIDTALRLDPTGKALYCSAQNKSRERIMNSSAAAGAQKPTHIRWWIVVMLFVVTSVNYADRAVLAITGPVLSKELGITAAQMGWVFSAFGWSYVLAQMPGGWLLDRFGSRITYFFSIFLWSVFTMLMGTVGFLSGGAAVATLFALRLLIGAAEAPSFPGNSRITSAWFPTHERGTA